MAASLDYVKDSLKRVSENVLEFELINHIESGSGYIGVNVLLDGKDVTEKSTMKIGEQEARQVKPYMFVASSYGDRVLFTIELDEPIKHDLHKVKVLCDVEMLGSYSAEFEGTV
ncbi:MAG: hypothetical protein ACE5NN_05330 [Candidatus Bathyarchaeia archaeon]